MYPVTLWARRETACYGAVAAVLDELGLVIDTSERPPQDIAREIWDRVQRGDGRVERESVEERLLIAAGTRRHVE